MALTGLTATKLHLSIPSSDTTQDAFLTQLLAAAEAAFLRLIDRQIEQATYTEYRSGKGHRTLMLNETPVSSITSVHYDPNGLWGQAPDGSFPSATLLTEGVDYALVKDGRNGLAETGRVMRIPGVWPGRLQWRAGLLSPQSMPSLGAIRVVYVAGYSSVPAEIPLAIWQTVAELMARRKNGLLKSSESFDGASLAFIQQEASQLLLLPGSRAQVVSRYRRITPRFDGLG